MTIACFTSPACARGRRADAAQGPAFGVYIHWPFCLSKCPYCDFNSHVRHAAIDEARFVRAFAGRDRRHRRARAGPHRLDHLLRRRHAVADAAGDRRRDPRRDRAALDGRARRRGDARGQSDQRRGERFRGYRAAGVNRVSLGVQALDDAALKELGRLHTAREALAAVAIARAVFERYSFDLIYARPRQTPEAWAAELKRAIAEAAEHLSLYQLTIEQDTPFAALHAAGKLVVPDEDHARALYDMTQEICAGAGLPAYEISNHARPGAECRHNLVYWRAHEYAGIGPGAHGRLDIDGERHATATEKRPEAWLMRVESLRARRGHRRGAHARRDGRRVPADGPAARRRHRSATLRPARRPPARPAPHRHPARAKARSRRPPTACCG